MSLEDSIIFENTKRRKSEPNKAPAVSKEKRNKDKYKQISHLCKSIKSLKAITFFTKLKAKSIGLRLVLVIIIKIENWYLFIYP